MASSVDDAQFQETLRVYANAQWISSTKRYYGHDSGRKIEYYWTPDSVEHVQAYYETFTLPFIGNKTMFHPYGGELKLNQEDFPYYWLSPEEQIDLSTDRDCHWSQKHTCVQVELFDFGKEDEVVLPDITASEFPYPATLEPAPPRLHGGTVIVYSYYVDTDFNATF